MLLDRTGSHKLHIPQHRSGDKCTKNGRVSESTGGVGCASDGEVQVESVGGVGGGEGVGGVGAGVGGGEGVSDGEGGVDVGQKSLVEVPSQVVVWAGIVEKGL